VGIVLRIPIVLLARYLPIIISHDVMGLVSKIDIVFKLISLLTNFIVIDGIKIKNIQGVIKKNDDKLACWF
tara:strand:+ start:390 stop:602 length:213 start_codon:yes stop_codon:yes gene_type:complete